MTSSTRLRTRALTTGVALASALVLAACGSGGSSDHSNMPGMSGASSPSSMGAMPSMSSMSSMPSASAPAGTGVPAGAHNSADVAFATGMIPHHRQAVAMADLAARRASSAKVKDLAARIKAAQDPEIQQISAWLTAWNQPVPEDMASMPGMDHSSGSNMPGMMDDAAMQKLQGLSGAAFDKAFLTMMIEHHRGAVTMAQEEQAKGSYAPAKQLAASIVKAQTAEIAEMHTMLVSR